MDHEDTSNWTDEQWKARERQDDLDMERLLNASTQQGDQPALFDDSRPLDTGDKADDAKDYEDLSDDDDDLPDEEPATGGHEEPPALTDDMDVDHDGFDDLFGEDDRELSPFGDDHDSFQQNGASSGSLTLPTQEAEPEDLRALNFPEHDDEANQDPTIPAVPEDFQSFVKQSWPTFEEHGLLNWNQLLPPKKAYFIPKEPAKPPKEVNPTKASLDLAPDQEKSFRSAGTATGDKRKRIHEAELKGLVAIVEESSDEGEAADEFNYLPIDPTEQVGGITIRDLEIICADFESRINPEIAEPQIQVEPEDEEMDDWEKEFLGYSAKSRDRKIEKEQDFVMPPQYPVPDFDNFEHMTAQVAKGVVLDLNDPYLLVDIQEFNPAAKRRKLGATGHFKRIGNGSFASTLTERFNISNDEAYDALKENHQSKVRATLGNLTVEHSMPAVKMQWPYYRVKLLASEARAFHRPALKFNKFLGHILTFSKPGLRKKKAIKNLPTHEIFKETKDLSLMDHYATATLLEYSEEHPTVLSNFGMGNRIINYYRRKNAEDTERPIPDDKIGDTQVLLPEDRSPFANFGMVDPGEIVRTIHNAMYRAPIFKHEPKNTDFLMIRSSTGIGGFSWHIRNIDNIFTVGQQFPSMEIPGPHSRKVTNAAKNRMKMIAYRKIRHSPHHQLKIQEITAHITDSTDMQNRQKLKEFINYDKTEKVWRMRAGDALPEESQIRAMVKPEEVCTIDAMQVGARYLEDAGYAAQDEDDGDGEGQSLEQNLAPWKTSKAFLEASADKAMLQLHGAGDPSGCGLAFSFIKTSMKGGYLEGIQQGPVATSAARMAIDPKANGGHGYNVKTQQVFYNNAIRDIWEKQKQNLSDAAEHEENDLEREAAAEEARLGAPTPYSNTPAPFDDNASQFSTQSRSGKVMRITRKHTNKFGQTDEVTETIKDPRIWHMYEKRRRELDADKLKYV